MLLQNTGGAKQLTTTSFLDEIKSLIDEDQVIDSTKDNQPYGNSGHITIHPQTEQEISDILQYASNHHLLVNIAGAGSKRGFGGEMESANILLSLEQYTGIVEHHAGDMTITVKAGTSFQEIQNYLKPFNQKIALDPFLPQQATIGGLIACNDSGPKRLGYGAARDAVIGLRIVYPDGKVIRSGGKVVKNVAGYDMNKLFIGSMGTIGVLSEVTIKLRPVTKDETTMLITFPNHKIEEIKAFSIQLLDSMIEPICFELLNPELTEIFSGEKSFALLISFEDVEKSVQYQEEYLKKQIPKNAKMKKLKGEDSANFWQAFYQLVPNALENPKNEKVKAAVKIGTVNVNIAPILKESSLIQDTCNVKIFGHGGLGHGIMQLYIDGAEVDVIDALKKLRSLAKMYNGYAVIRHLPFNLRKQIDTWGEKPSSFFLLEGIKEKIDPKRMLNRHRYVGGI